MQPPALPFAALPLWCLPAAYSDVHKIIGRLKHTSPRTLAEVPASHGPPGLGFPACPTRDGGALLLFAR